ncbi:MAG: ComEC/Rec2 family competence protein, partial [Planctomycetota bacterium]|nr:ComEC/Rec2 family competence protein [Planctomycetota bacterium]
MLALRPLVWLAFAFGSGLLAGRLLPIRGWTLWLLWLLAAAAAGWCLARARGKNRRPAERPNAMPLSAAGEAPWLDLQSREWLLFCLGCLAFLAGWARQVETTAERERLSALIPDFFQAEVAITAPPDQPPENLRPAKWVCSGRLLAINGAAAPEMPVRICGEGASRFGGGDILRGWVIREAARPPAYPAAFNLARYLESQGYIAALRFTRPAGRGAGDAYAVTPAPRLSGLRLAQEMRRNAIQHILAAFPSPAGAFLAAITFGYRPPPHTAEGLAELQDNFRRAGIAHVMAISGMNVALVAGMVWWLLSLVISDRRFIAFAAIATCFLYLLLSGMEVSALRATLMAVIHLGGYIIGRRGDLVNSLAAAALLIAAYNPGALFDIGFQLSFTAVLFLALLGETWAPAADLAEAAWHSGNLLRAIGHRLWRYLAALFAMSAAATIGCTPLVAYHFLQFSLIGLLANIAVVPLSTLVLAAGLLAPATACPFLPGRDLFTSLLVAPTSLLIRIADLFSHLPGASVATAPLPGWTLALYYAGFAAFFLRKARLPAVWQGRLRSLALTAIAASVLAMCLSLIHI